MKLSPTMRRMLIALNEKKGLEGMHIRTLEALERFDLVSDPNPGDWEITPYGARLASSWKCAACGHYAYHCPVSGCNHHDGGAWCSCTEFVEPKDAIPELTQIERAVLWDASQYLNPWVGRGSASTVMAAATRLWGKGCLTIGDRLKVAGKTIDGWNLVLTKKGKLACPPRQPEY